MNFAKRISKHTLPFGGVVLCTPFPSHGAVSIIGSVSGGKRFAGTAEFAKVHAGMLLEGTTRHSKQAIQIILDRIGAELSFTSGDDRLIFAAKVRQQHLTELLSLIAEILAYSQFPKKELRALTSREKANLALEAQSTQAQARIALTRLLFKKGHPNFSETTSESQKILTTITPEKLRRFHLKTVSSSSLIISLAGAVEPKKTTTLVAQAFAVVPTQHVVVPTFKKATVGSHRQSFYAIREKASIDYMTGIAMGITSEHPFYASLMLGIQILGIPGFSGRMMSTIREIEGLTYGVYGYLAGTNKNTDGYIAIWGTFAPELFKKGKAAIQREIQLLVKGGVTNKEVQKHRALFVARNKVQMSDSSAFARAAHNITASGWPLSEIDAFPRAVSKLTKTEVDRAIKKYLIVSKLSEAAAGPVVKAGRKP